MEGLLGAAQNVEEKWLSPLCGISGLMDGSGQFDEACAWRGQTPQAGQGWFIRVPLEGAHSSVQQLSVGISFLTCETPIKLYHLYSLWLREAFAGYIPRKGYAVRGSSDNSVWSCEFWGRLWFCSSTPPNFLHAKPFRALLHGLFPYRKIFVSLIFHRLVRKKEKLSREGSTGWNFDFFGQLSCSLLLPPRQPFCLKHRALVFFIFFSSFSLYV